ncbi:hypothetical protein CPB85DRAFT_1327742 [Mucidula mucida]|nr:hypothetical protein CPB85DRAFT_1327742 [Mucidula mucida]
MSHTMDKQELFDALSFLASPSEESSRSRQVKGALLLRFLSTLHNLSPPAVADGPISASNVAKIALAIDGLHVYSELYRVADNFRLDNHILLPLSLMQAAKKTWPSVWKWITYLSSLGDRFHTLRMPISMNTVQTRQTLFLKLRPDDEPIRFSVSSKLYVGHVLYSIFAHLTWEMSTSVVDTPGLVEIMTRLYLPYSGRTDATTLMKMWQAAPSDAVAERVLARLLSTSACSDIARHYSDCLQRYMRVHGRDERFVLHIGSSVQFLWVIIRRSDKALGSAERMYSPSTYIYLLPVCEKALRIAANSLLVDNLDPLGVASVLNHCCNLLVYLPFVCPWYKRALRNGLYQNLIRCWLSVTDEQETPPPILIFVGQRLAPALLSVPVLRIFLAVCETLDVQDIHASPNCNAKRDTFSEWSLFLGFIDLCQIAWRACIHRHAYCGSCQKDMARPEQLRCRGCQRVTYCSRLCQKKAWPEHRSLCLRHGSEKIHTKWLAGDFLALTRSEEEAFLLSRQFSYLDRSVLQVHVLLQLKLHRALVNHRGAREIERKGNVLVLCFDFTKLDDTDELIKAGGRTFQVTLDNSHSKQPGVDVLALVMLDNAGVNITRRILVAHMDWVEFWDKEFNLQK